jgi:hypothetical protein
MINPNVYPAGVKRSYQSVIASSNKEFYSSIDWALDISQAAFFEADLRGVPARLIRRDKETQVVVTREKALQGAWREIDLDNTYWRTSLELFLRRGDDDVVLVAPRADATYKILLRGLMRLREAGVAEPD